MEPFNIPDEDLHREELPKSVDKLTDEQLKRYLGHHCLNPEKWQNEIDIILDEINKRTLQGN